MTEKKYSILAAAFGVCAGAAALMWYYYTLDAWSGVPPHYMEDTIFYFARMKEVVDGHLFFGNPYYIEHQSGVAPSFTISDWFAAIPLALSHSWAVTLVVNTIVWNGLYTFVTYRFMRQWGLGGVIGILATLAAVTQTYYHLQRPVHIQVSAVFFPLLLLVFSWWLQRPRQRGDALFEKHTVVLGATLALGMYAYTFVGQIGFALLGVTVLWAAITRRWLVAWQALLAAGIAALLLAPLIVFLSGVMADLYYANSMGMVFSRLPQSAPMNFSRVIFAGLALLGASVVVLKKHLSAKHLALVRVLGGSLVAMLIVSFSNVITGRYLEFGEHVKQFSYPLVAIVIVVCVWWGIKYRAQLKENKVAAVVAVIFLCGALVFVVRNAVVRNQLRFFDPMLARHVQTYRTPLSFLDVYARTPSVVLAPERMTPYVSIVSHHYVAYTFQGFIFAPPHGEQAQRQELSDRYEAIMRGATIDARAGAAFVELLNRFHVRFVVWERRFAPRVDAQRMFALKKIYEDDQHVIYER